MPRGWPVAALGPFLAGSWAIGRSIRDRRSGQRGWFEGQATMAPGPGGLAYRETGRLRFGGHCGEAWAEYRFVPVGAAGASVLFPDGRLFHRLDLGAGIADVEHRCGADLYRGRYRVTGPDRWTLLWVVAGPAKALIIRSRYDRLA